MAPDDRPRAIREAPREEVNDKLTTMLETAERALRNSGDGVAMLLEEYRYGLKYEPDEVEAAISQYTAVIAETCQGVARKEIHNIQERWPQPGFENVIVDEGARADPLDLFIPMTQARRRIILVGDQNQLPHNLEPVLEKEMLEEEPDPVKEALLKKSLFERLFEQLEEQERHDGVRRTIMLDTQFRMHPRLGDFVSRNFYGGNLKSGLEAELFSHGLDYRKDGRECVAVWIDVHSDDWGYESRGRGSKTRPQEVRPLAQEAEKIAATNPDLSIGVMSFYSAQVRALESELQQLRTRRPDMHIGTVDSFQGREFDVVLLSMTRSNAPLRHRTWDRPDSPEAKMGRRRYGFLTLLNRVNVALSRQKRVLIVVGDSGMLDYKEAQSAIGPLIDFYQLCRGEHGLVIKYQ